MDAYKIVALVSFALCLSMLAKQFLNLIAAGKPKDYSKPAGNIIEGVRYSFTGAMSPLQKESAYLHFPTYIAGVIFHAGIFLAIILFSLQIFIDDLFNFSFVLSRLSSFILAAGSMSGLAILLKRVFNKNLRAISGADDFISNILTTASLTISSILFYTGSGYAVYFIVFGILFLWIPIGKTRHLLYFFFARYHLGAFYGRRGTWPQKQSGNE